MVCPQAKNPSYAMGILAYWLLLLLLLLLMMMMMTSQVSIS